MAYDEGLAQRIREVLDVTPGIEEKKMFGGVGFLLKGNMACGVNEENLIVRVGPDNYENALKEPHVREFDMTGKPMTGWIVVEPPGFDVDEDLIAWIARGVIFTSSLPAK